MTTTLLAACAATVTAWSATGCATEAPAVTAPTSSETVAAAADAGIAVRGARATDRPRDPWVFRSVLDEQARMIVVALHERLWLAYDASNGELAKAWAGDVVMQGAVHDAVHGPQPVSRGRMLLGRAPLAPGAAADAAGSGGPAGSVTGLPGDGPEPAFRALEPDRGPERPAPWRLLVEGRPVESDCRWLGYVLRDDGVVLRYALRSGGETMAIIEEAPDVLDPVGDRLPFVRRIVLRESAPQVDVELRLPASGRTGPRGTGDAPLDWRVRGGALRTAEGEPDLRVVRLARAGATVLRLELPVE